MYRSFENLVGIKHVGRAATSVRNIEGPVIFWRAVLPGRFEWLWVDGQRQQATQGTSTAGESESWIMVELEPGQVRTVSSRK